MKFEIDAGRSTAGCQPYLLPGNWPEVHYNSPYEAWDSKAWCRVGPIPKGPLERGPYQYFARAQTSYFGHPAVEGATERQQDQLLALHVDHWLDFTVRVEDVVLDSARVVQQPAFAPWLPEEVRRDARILAIDEVLHGHASADGRDLVRAHAGIEPIRLPHPAVEYLTSGLSVDRLTGDLQRVARAIGTETLTSGELGKAAQNPEVYPTLDNLILFHARDEAAHRSQHISLLKALLPGLSPSGIQLVAVEIGRTLLAYLTLDERWLAEALRQVGIGSDPVSIAREIASHEDRMVAIREGSRRAVEMLKRLGALDDPEIADEFDRLGIL